MVTCLFGFGDVEKRVPFILALMQSSSVMQSVRLESTVPGRKLGYASLQAESRARLPQGPMCWEHTDKSACSFSVLDPRFATLLPRSPHGQTAYFLLSSLLPAHVHKRPFHQRAASGWPPFRRFGARVLRLEPATSFPLQSSPRESGGGGGGSLSRHCRESV